MIEVADGRVVVPRLSAALADVPSVRGLTVEAILRSSDPDVLVDEIARLPEFGDILRKIANQGADQAWRADQLTGVIIDAAVTGRQISPGFSGPNAIQDVFAAAAARGGRRCSTWVSTLTERVRR